MTDKESLEKALECLRVHGVTKERCGGDVCRGIDVLESRYRKDINAALAEIAVLKDSGEAANRLSDALVETVNDPNGRLSTLERNCEELTNALKSLVYRVYEWRPHKGTDVYEAASSGEAVLAHVTGKTIPCEGCAGDGLVHLPGGPTASCAECGGRGYIIKPEGAEEGR